MKPTVLLLLPLAIGCAGTHATAPRARPISELNQEDFVMRLAERLAAPERTSTPELMTTLEQQMGSWQTEQSLGREEPLEHILTVRVVTHYKQVEEAFLGANRSQRLVAAWALGFSRVPPNEQGVDSPHLGAVRLLADALSEADDELLRNVLTALWKLGDPSTPRQPLLDLMLNHHDPDVRANAALALGTVLTPATAPYATDGVLVALRDAEPKVRLHAASVARRFPSPATTARLLQLLPTESVPLVRAGMASALGAARDRDAAPLLVGMLGQPRSVDCQAARAALIRIFGVDRGDQPAAWSDLLR